jgi:predicted Zn-dependent peptidase
MAKLLWPHHALGQSITGTPETLAGLTVEHLRRQLRDFIYPANAILGVCGNVRPEAVFASVRRHLGDWDHAETAPRQPLTIAGNGHHGPTVKTVHDADNQFHVQLSFHAPGYNGPEEVPLMVLTRLLDDGPNSLLQRIVREDRALVYGITAGYTGYQDAGQFDIATSVRAEHLPPLLETLTEIVHRVRGEGPALQDLEGARLRHRFDLEFGRDSLYGWVDRYAWPLLYSTVRDEAAELEQVGAVGAEQLRALAERLFTGDKLHLAIVGPVDRKTEDVVWEAVGRW